LGEKRGRETPANAQESFSGMNGRLDLEKVFFALRPKIFLQQYLP
jgi:hypothetical protein